DQRHRPVALSEHALIDLELVEALDAADLDPVDFEPGLPGGFGEAIFGHRRKASQAGNHPHHGRADAQDAGEKAILKLLLGEWKIAHQPVDQFSGRAPRLLDATPGALRARLTAGAGRAAFDLAAHRAVSP